MRSNADRVVAANTIVFTRISGMVDGSLGGLAHASELARALGRSMYGTATIIRMNFARSCLITTAAFDGRGVTTGSRARGRPVRHHREGTTCATVAGLSPVTLNCPGVAGRDGA